MRTKNQETILKILEYINGQFFALREIPSTQQIADHFGIAKSSTSRYLKELEKKGLITRDNTHYSIETLEMKKVVKNLSHLPVVGSIACGTPILAEQNIDSYLTISGDFLGTGSYFALLAKGNSMIKAGIEDGDYVVVRQQATAEAGQIVVALTEDNECTLKRYYYDGRRKKHRLHPENDSMSDMYFDKLEIQGIAIKVIKNLDN